MAVRRPRSVARWGMPTSHFHQLNEITELIKHTSPGSLLDVGVGFGKFGLLAREYLDVWNERLEKKDWKARIEGVEVFPQYLTPVHHHVYDAIHVGNALDVLPKLHPGYDLVLLIDVLEHFTKPDGDRILGECQRISRNTLISTPKDIGHQEASHGNAHEEHLFQWEREHLEGLPSSFFVPNPKSHLCYFGKDAPRLALEMGASRLKRGVREGLGSLVDAIRGRA